MIGTTNSFPRAKSQAWNFLKFKGKYQQKDFYTSIYPDTSKSLTKEPDSFTKQIPRIEYCEENVIDEEATEASKLSNLLKHQQERTAYAQALSRWVSQKTKYDEAQVKVHIYYLERDRIQELRQREIMQKQLLHTGVSSVVNFFTRVDSSLADVIMFEVIEDAVNARYPLPDFPNIPEPPGPAPTPPGEIVQPDPVWKKIQKKKTFMTQEVVSNHLKVQEAERRKKLQQLEERLSKEKFKINLTINDINLVNESCNSPFAEVRVENFKILSTLREKSGGYSALKGRYNTSKPAIEYIRSGFLENLDLCQSAKGDFDKKAKALKVLYLQEKDITNQLTSSQVIYPERFLDESEKVKLSVLRAMQDEPTLRSSQEQFNHILEASLLSESDELKTAAMQGIQAKPFHSRSVNLELERLAKIGNKNAIASLRQLENAGFYREFNPSKMAKKIASRWSGNNNPVIPDLEGKLTTLFEDHKTHLLPYGPNTELYLLGQDNSEINTKLVKDIASTAFGPSSLVEIDFSKPQSLEGIQKTLRNTGTIDKFSSKIHLANKVIHLININELDRLQLSEADSIRNYFKPVFEKGPTNEFDFKDSLLVVSTQKPLSQTKTFGSSYAGTSALQRLKENSQFLRTISKTPS